VSAFGAIDQVCLAITHFTLTVMVARVLGIDALGKFAFLYALIVLASMAHGALLGESIGVSPTVVGAVERHGLQVILIPAACLAGSLAVAVQPLSIAISQQALNGAPFLCALVGCLFYWTARSYFYKLHSPVAALSLTVTYGIGTLLSFILLPLILKSTSLRQSYERPLLAIAIGAAATLIVAIALWSRGHYNLPLIRGKQWLRNPDTHRVWVDVIHYGKWSLPATFLVWLATNGYYIAMPIFGDNQGTAALRATIMIVFPINTLITGASAAILPILSDRIRQDGLRSVKRLLHIMAGLAAVGGLVFGIVLMTNSDLVMRTIYGPDFAQYAPLLQITAILPGLWAASAVYRTGIRATRQSFNVFQVYAIAMFPVGIILMIVLSRLGPLYAACGAVLTQVLVLLAFVWSARRIDREA